MLKVKKSQLPNAGKGLFTTTPIKKGELIIEYGGELLTWREVQKRYPGDIHAALYLFHLGPNKWIDAQNTTEHLARYANDARGFSKIKGLNNNAEYQIHQGKPYIVATRNIQAGEEIFVSYTKDYWDALKAGLKNNR
jgi:SET domain-containing protein